MPNVTYKRKELKTVQSQYTIIRDCLAGEQQIKAQSTKYLPMPNENDESEAAEQRYSSYKKRAVFYGATNRTLRGLCGQIFMRDPIAEFPTELEVIEKDADGSGVSLIQLAKRGARMVLGYGRLGLFADYPAVDGKITREQLDNGDVRPTITAYEPWRIINWRTKTRGARVLLELVVLEEDYITSDDGFEAKKEKQYRVLRLTDKDEYTVTIYRRTAKGSGSYAVHSSFTPTLADGTTLDEIPFTFVGSENNDSSVDEPPMYDIASLNVAHYRNSADYEESSFMVGQPTPVFAGLTEDWVQNVLKGKVMLGSRGAVMLPENASADLLQAGANTMPYEAMQHKERQMIALGARLVEQKRVARTATETAIDNTSENSVLASTAKNLSAGIMWCLQWCAKFAGVAPTEEDLKFVLNTDFDIAKMSPEDRRQLIEEWQQGAIAFEEMRANLRKSGIATLKDDDARDAIEIDQAQIPGAEDTGEGNINEGDGDGDSNDE
jgi:hypothetical protein